MTQKRNLGHERAVLLNTIMKRNLSEQFALRTAEIIKNTRLQYDSKAADEKAAELTEIINSCETEQEMLEAIKGM